MINSNLCRISHRFGDTAAYWSKIANSYPPHPHSTLLGVIPFEFWDELDIPTPESRMMGLPYGEEIMIVGRTTQSTSVTDKLTDRRTDRITIANTVQRIESHGINRMIISVVAVKIWYLKNVRFLLGHPVYDGALQ